MPDVKGFSETGCRLIKNKSHRRAGEDEEDGTGFAPVGGGESAGQQEPACVVGEVLGDEPERRDTALPSRVDDEDETGTTLWNPVTGVTLDKTEYVFHTIGETMTLDPTISPSDASDKQVNLFFARLARHFSYEVSALLGTKARAYRSKNSHIHKKVIKKKNFYAFFLTFGLLSKMCSTFPALKCLTLKTYLYEHN